MLGALGTVSFKVNSDKILTFGNLSRTCSARYATHEVIGKRPILEYIGPGVYEGSLDIRLDAGLGINPQKELKKIHRVLTRGRAVPLIIGDEYFGNYVLTEISEVRAIHSAQGDLIRADVALKLREAFR